MLSVSPPPASKRDEISPENQHNDENKKSSTDHHDDNHLSDTTRTDVVVDVSVVVTRASPLKPPTTSSTTNTRSILRKSNRYSPYSQFQALSEIGRMFLIGVGFPFVGHILCWYLLPSCTLFNVCMLCWIFSSLVNIIFDLQEKGYPSSTDTESRRELSSSSSSSSSQHSRRVRFESTTKFRRLPRPMSRREKAEFVQRRFEGRPSSPSSSSKRRIHRQQNQYKSKQFTSKGARRQENLDRYVTYSSSLIEDDSSSESNDNHTPSIDVCNEQNEKSDSFSNASCCHSVSTEEETEVVQEVSSLSDLIGDSETPIARIRRASSSSSSSSSLPPIIDERGGCFRTTCGRNENEHPNLHNNNIPSGIEEREAAVPKATSSSSNLIKNDDESPIGRIHRNNKNCNKNNTTTVVPVEGRGGNNQTSIPNIKPDSKLGGGEDDQYPFDSISIIAAKQQQRRRYALGDVGNRRQ